MTSTQKLSVLALLSLAAAVSAAPPPLTVPPWNVSPIGGALGQDDYSAIPHIGTNIQTFAQLTSGLASGVREFWIPPATQIILPATHQALVLPTGTKIRSWGGVMKVPSNPAGSGIQAAIIASRGTVLLEGVRLIGPSTVSTTTDEMIGIQAQSGTLTVRHCEIVGWPWAGISIKTSQGVIENNLIHHNISTSLGYGIVVQNGNANAAIRWNLFENNRHSIAGSGAAGESYLAEYNVQLPAGLRHAFDMHANGGIGGRLVTIRSNVFQYGGTPYGHYPSVAIIGLPTEGQAGVSRNRFSSAQSFQDALNRTKYAVEGYVTLTNNQFGATMPLLACLPNGALWGDAKYFQEATGAGDINNDGIDELIRIDANGQAYVSVRGLGEWAPISPAPNPASLVPALSADMDGDGSPDGIQLKTAAQFQRPW